MTTRLASVALVLGAALADAAGQHSLAYYSLVAAVPVVAGGSPPLDPLLQSAVFLSVVVTIGSFFFVQPLIDLAGDAAASLPF